MTVLDSPDKIAEAGERIYADRHKDEMERHYLGQFVAVDVLTGEAYVAQYPEEVLEEARKKAPTGVFHLIRVGAPGAFKVSFGAARHDFWGRVLRPTR